MNVLIVDDEVGIREGVGAFVRLSGHTVRTAGSIAEARAALEDHDFDVVVSDWRLGDGVAIEFLRDRAMPRLVMSGHPDDVVGLDDAVDVLAKPVMPTQIVAWIGASVCDDVPATAEPLPSDTADRVALVRELCGAVEILDDGEFVTVTAAAPDDAALERIEACGGDLRVLAPPDGARLELRLFRDGRPDDATSVAPGDTDWPSVGDVAIDFDGADLDTADVADVLDRMRSARVTGRTVWALNVSESVRDRVHALGRSDELPMRPMSGPRLPAVLSELWS